MHGYGTTARLFHWITVLLVLSTIPVGTLMVQEGLERAVQDSLFIYHKNVGLILLLLVLLRLAWRLLYPPPPLPESVPVLQRLVAGAVHGGLYAMLLFMAVTGFVRVRAGGFPVELLDWLGVPPMLPLSDRAEEIAQTLHFYGRYVLIALIALHVGAALYHGLIRRDGVFGRMWPLVRTSRG